MSGNLVSESNIRKMAAGDYNGITKECDEGFYDMYDNDVVGFFTMRRPNEFFNELRFGFVIVDSRKRGRGYGKNMLKLGLKYAKEIFGVNKVSLGVFENNESAYYCYKAIGFEDVSQDEIEKYTVMGEEWNCLELEINL